MNGETATGPWLALLSAHLAATFYMVGLAWFVQRVHYPLFAGVGAERFAAYQREHVSRTSPVVGPPMLVEAASALALVALPRAFAPPALVWLGIALLIAVWSSTALLQIPRHRDLASGFSASAHRRLVATNWIRTSAWTLRGAVALGLVFSATAAGVR